MKTARTLLLLLLGLLLIPATGSFACTCGDLSESDTDYSLGKVIRTGVDGVKTGIHYTTEATCMVIHETPKQIAAIPNAIHEHMSDARESAGSLLDRSMNLLADAGHAVINFSASLLRILFSSFLARA